MSSKIEVIGSKHQGDREQQQDDIFYQSSDDDQTVLCVIADGMGGHTGGKAASSCLTTSAKLIWKEQILKGIDRPCKEIMQDLVLQAYDMMKNYEEKDNISPRSTCVILLIDENTAHYCHVGDSRLYHFRGHKLLDRTKDHSVVQMLVEMGEVKEEEMGTHEDQGRLLKWIGGKKPPEPSYKSVEIEAGDQFLLCSDGLWEYLSTKEMEQSFTSKENATDTLKRFIFTARQRAKPNGDNVSLVLCNIPENKPPINIRVAIIGAMALLASALAFLYFSPLLECAK